MQQIERAIFDLRRGLPVVIQSGDTSTLVAPVESLMNLLGSAMPGCPAAGLRWC